MPSRPGPAERIAARAKDPAVQATLALGISQIIGWGTSVYALGVLGGAMMDDLGWSRGLVFGGLSIGLLSSGIASTLIGRLIDRHGARAVMTVGALLMALGQVWLSQVESLLGYLAAWGFLGLAMRMTLYDAAFVALVQVTPGRGRQAISYLTLFGGLASTVFWPIGHELAGAYGWRMTWIVYGALNLGLCLPLHYWGLARREAPSLAATPDNGAVGGPVGEQAGVLGAQVPPALSKDDQLIEGPDKLLAMLLFGTAMSASGFIIGAAAVHLVDIIVSSGHGMASAVFIASWKGIAQVAGRLCDIICGKGLPPMALGRISILFLPLSLLVLIAGGQSLVVAMIFVWLFGVGNGLVTILRGAVPLQLFGRQGYGEVIGVLATPFLIVGALAPMLLAVVIDQWGYEAGKVLLLVMGLLSYGAMEAMAQWMRRRAA